MKKKNILRKVLLVAGLVGGTVALASCNGNIVPTQSTTPAPVETTTTPATETTTPATTTTDVTPTTTTTPVVQKFNVTFNVNGGSNVAAQEVEEGSTATRPTNPNKAGNRFDGWFTSSDNGATLSATAYDFSTAVTADVTLYAKWVEAETVELTVHQNPNDASATVVVNVALDRQSGNTWYGIPDLEDPTDEYKEFAGWYSDAELQTPAEIADGIEGPTEIWAKWAPKYESVTSGFSENGGNGLITWENLAKAAGFTLGTNTTAEKSYGVFSFATGLRVHDKTMMNTQGKAITVTLSGIENELHVSGMWGSGSKGRVYVEKQQADGSFEKIYTSETEYAADKQALDPIDLTKLAAGVYKITSDKTTKLTSIAVVQKLEKSPVSDFAFTVDNTQFLANTVADAAALKAALGVAVNKVYGNGRIEAVTADDTALVVNVDDVNLTTEGEYTAKVKYGDFAAKEFTVKVFGVDSISANMYALDSSRATKHVQEIFVTGDEFNSKNLSIVAHAKCGTATKDFTLASGFTATKGNDGVVTVTYQSKTTTYQTYTLDASLPDHGSVVVYVNPNAPVSNSNFHTITQALQYLEAAKYENDINKLIQLTEGTYNEKVYVTIPNLAIFGADTLDDASKYVIEFDALAGQLDPSGKYLHSTDGSATFTVAESAKNFAAQGITFKNHYNTNDLYNESKDVEKAVMKDTQAVALLVRADQSAFESCRMTSYHDTLYADKGRQAYLNCYIEGRTDYIFGGSTVTAYFGNCTIHTLVGDLNEAGTAKSGNGGYVACTKGSALPYDYIFDGCTFEADATVLDGSVSLGRTWDSGMKLMIMRSTISAAYSKADFNTKHKDETTGITYNDRYTEMNTGKSPSKANIFEFQNTGAGALTATEAANYEGVTVKADDATDVLGKFNNALVIFAGGNSVYADTWTAPAYALDADVTPIIVNYVIDGKTYDFDTYKGAFISENRLKELVSFNVGEGFAVEGFYTDAAMTTKHNAATALSGNVTIYVKTVNTAALAVSAATYNFESKDAGEITTTVSLGEDVSLVCSSGKKGTIATVSANESAVDGPKKYTNVNGEEVTASKVYKTGGATTADGRYLVVDLTKYTGKAVIEVIAVTGSKDQTGRHVVVSKASAISENDTLLSFEVGNDVPTTGNTVTVNCGAKYYVLADASVNFYAINVKPVQSAEPKVTTVTAFDASKKNDNYDGWTVTMATAGSGDVATTLGYSKEKKDKDGTLNESVVLVSSPKLVGVADTSKGDTIKSPKFAAAGKVELEMISSSTATSDPIKCFVDLLKEDGTVLKTVTWNSVTAGKLSTKSTLTVEADEAFYFVQIRGAYKANGTASNFNVLSISTKVTEFVEQAPAEKATITAFDASKKSDNYDGWTVTMATAGAGDVATTLGYNKEKKDKDGTLNESVVLVSSPKLVGDADTSKGDTIKSTKFAAATKIELEMISSSTATSDPIKCFVDLLKEDGTVLKTVTWESVTTGKLSTKATLTVTADEAFYFVQIRGAYKANGNASNFNVLSITGTITLAA